MRESLSRLKPDPVPVIHPVPEHDARGALKEVYERTKRGFDVPWMGVVAMAFAHYPHFYERLWSALEPIARTEAFASACRELRRVAEREAAELAPPSIVGRLESDGYGAREIEEIRACNEIFSAGNMPYLLMASLARALLEGHAWDGVGDLGPTASRRPPEARPPLIEPHHADPSLTALYADIRQSLGLPFVNTDYRAFARWPSYFLAAWGDLKPKLPIDAYAARTQSVHEAAVMLALNMPNPTRLSSTELQEAARKDGPLEEILSVVRLFQWLLPGLAVNVAFLRDQLQEL